MKDRLLPLSLALSYYLLQSCSPQSREEVVTQPTELPIATPTATPQLVMPQPASTPLERAVYLDQKEITQDFVAALAQADENKIISLLPENTAKNIKGDRYLDSLIRLMRGCQVTKGIIITGSSEVVFENLCGRASDSLWVGTIKEGNNFYIDLSQTVILHKDNFNRFTPPSRPNP